MTVSQPQGFLAVPTTGNGPGVLALHAWWGLNDTIKMYCTQLAEAGFVVFAPDLYHSRVTNIIAEAEVFAQALDANYRQIRAEIVQATRFLSERADKVTRGLAVIGFSLGAYYALDLSATCPEYIRSVVFLYGTGLADFSNSKAAYLGHFAANDPFEPQANIDSLEDALKQAGRPVTFYHYSGTRHRFCEPDREQAYNPAAARPAWDRILHFPERGTTDDS
ncbi:dienelactone hydrolase family protein [Chloroflexus sp.]|uniref:dienelactone hydrolase family protein n=1 Tax=Chloroflexus sp. TaxID=1904827 RepID=UPI0040498E71